MKPFLYQVAEAFYKNEPKELSQIAFVFPNRRSGLFFKHYLHELAVDAPSFSPTILTINTLFTELSGLQQVDKTELLFHIYEEYCALKGKVEAFDQFIFWGEMLAGDFDDVDKYMVDAKQLFANINDLKEMDSVFQYLDEEQKKVIEQFWRAFFTPDKESEQKEMFVSLWNIMHDLYNNVRQRLLDKGMGYEGMIFRKVADAAKSNQLPPLSALRSTRLCKKVVFVGFNAINTAEREILQYFKRSKLGDFYWDYYAPTLLIDDENRANFFIKENLRQFPSAYELSEPSIKSVPEMTVIPVPSGVGQAKHAGYILSELKKKAHLDAENALNTAVVLPDESLLMPMLYAIPESIKNINITMGYPLRNTSVAALINAISRLQARASRSTSAQYYHIEVSAILNHRLVSDIVGREEIDRIIDDMNKQNMVFVSAEYFTSHPHELLQTIFAPITSHDEAPKYMESVLEMLLGTISDDLEDSDEQHEMKSECSPLQLEYEYVYHYRNIVSRLNDVMQLFPYVSIGVATYFNMIGKLSHSVPFEGEPLSGLQVMGVLETRALDFENIIILSMNEGVFPAKRVANSFIPYNLRRGYKMATSEHQDSIYAYYFYRLISRAKRVYMTYDIRTEGVVSGELSRFIYQLNYHYKYQPQIPNIKVNECNLKYGLTIAPPSSPISISKKGRVASKLNEFIGDNATRRISASALKDYLNCPFQFYLRNIEGLKPEDEIVEDVDSGKFGTIYHDTMAQIYDDLKAGASAVEVTKSMLEDLLQKKDYIMGIIESEYNTTFLGKGGKSVKLTGKNLLAGKAVYSFVKYTLTCDKEQTPFLYRDSELRMQENLYYTLSDGRKVSFKALIDRVDQMVNKTTNKDELRIIDYKTGKDEVTIESIDLLLKGNHNKMAIFQLLIYCMLYKQMHPENTLPLRPVIYLLRNVRSGIVNNVRIHRKEVLYSDVEEEFEQFFRKIMDELFDESIDFTQTQDEEHCTYCDFKEICQRYVKKKVANRKGNARK